MIYFRDSQLSWNQYLELLPLDEDPSDGIQFAKRYINQLNEQSWLPAISKDDNTIYLEKDDSNHQVIYRSQTLKRPVYSISGQQESRPNLVDLKQKAISNTLPIIASRDAMLWVFSTKTECIREYLPQNTNEIDMILNFGFIRTDYLSKEFSEGITGLGHDFHWAMSLLLHKVNIHQLMMGNISLSLNIPDFQKERQYFIEQACKHYKNSLYPEALDNFIKAESYEKYDPFILFTIGLLYLYYPKTVNPEKALTYFIRAAKYFLADKQIKQTAESYYHAGIAAYLLNEDQKAQLLSKQAYETFPQFLEAGYNYVKFLAVQGDSSGLTILSDIINKDRMYAIKSIADWDFLNILHPLHQLLYGFRQNAKSECDKIHFEMLTDRNLEKYKENHPNEFNQWKTLFNEANLIYQRNTFFDYLDCLPVLKKSEPHYMNCKKFITSPPGYDRPTDYTQTFEPVDEIPKDEKDISDKEIIELLNETKAMVHHTTMSSYLEKLTPSQTEKINVLLDNPVILKQVGSLIGHPSSVYCVAISNDASMIASGTESNTIKIWNLRERKELGTLIGHLKAVNSVAFSPNNEFLISASWDNTSKIWNLKTYKEITTLKYHVKPVERAVFSPDGQLIATVSHDKNLIIWDHATRKVIRCLSDSPEAIRYCEFSPDALMIAACTWEYIILWDVETGKEIIRFKAHMNNYIGTISFSPDGLTLASGSHDNTIKLWDLKTYKEISTLRGHSRRVNSIIFSPDCLILASASHDKTIKVWNIKTSKEICTLTGHNNVVSSVAISQDGFLLISGSYDKTVKIWDIEYKLMPPDALKEIIRRNNEDALLRRRAHWRSQMRCEECGVKLGFLDTLKGRIRCSKHA